MNESFIFKGKRKERHRDDDGDRSGMHSENFFDQNEDASGETVDLATGKKIDNSTDLGLDGLSILSEIDLDVEDDPVDTGGDEEAKRWLRENADKL
jgi:hypothetical protein